MRRTTLFTALAALAALAASCGDATLDVQPGPQGDLASAQAGLTVRLKEKLGPTARLEQVFGRGDEVVLGVALEDSVADSDVQTPLALATWRRSDDALDVLEAAPAFREALRLGASTALVTKDGDLEVRAADGATRRLAGSVRGELAPAPNDALLFVQESLLADPGETAVMIATAEGTLVSVADAEGVDDRPSVSPDGQTVVFVSGRSGVASLWRTTLAGGEPAQLTNAGLEAGLEREGAPEGFVPPPVDAASLEWVSPDVVRYDAGGGEYWRIDVRTGAATQEGA